MEKYTKLLNEPSVHTCTIMVNNRIVGSIAKFEIEGDAEITYWIDRNCRNKGVATAALINFLTLEKARPIFGRIAAGNFGPQHVLEKCGFIRIAKDIGFVNARQTD